MKWLMRILGKRSKKRDGFTLVELMIVVIVVGILAAAAIPIYWWAMARAYSSEGKALLGAIRSVEQIYFAEHDAWQVLNTAYANDDALEADIGIKTHHNKWWHAKLLSYTTTKPATPTGSVGTGPWVVADGTILVAVPSVSPIDKITLAIDLANGEFLVSYDSGSTWKVE